MRPPAAGDAIAGQARCHDTKSPGESGSSCGAGAGTGLHGRAEERGRRERSAGRAEEVAEAVPASEGAVDELVHA